MATKLYCRISAHSELVLEVFVEYDDSDYLVESNDDGENDDFALIRFFGTNHSAYAKTVTTFKANGGVQWVRTIPPHTDFSVNAGGAVKYESDIPRWVFD